MCSVGVAYNQCSAVMTSEETADKNSSAAETVAAVAMSLLTAVAIVGNLAVLVVIIRSPSLRVQLTNFFVINLCIVDLVAAIVVMPMSLAGVTARSSLTNTTLQSGSTNADRSTPCIVFRLFSAFVAFASVLSIVLANIERYVSIRHPMHHAAHLTVGRTLVAIVSVWVAAVGVAATPVLANWNILDAGTHCCAAVTGNTPAAAAMFVVVVFVLFFVAPVSMMAAMCCSIYRVARQAGRQVVPGVSDGHRDRARPQPTQPSRGSSSTISAVSCQSLVSCPSLNHVQRHNNIGLPKSASVVSERSPNVGRKTQRHAATSPWPTVRGAPECIIRVTCYGDDRSTVAATDQRHRNTASPTTTPMAEAQTSAGTVADRRWKAAATLLFVLLTFVPLWSPYFLYNMYRAIERYRQAFDCGLMASADHIERAVLWIGFATFASNAFVYGWMNRAIRDALRDTVDGGLCRCATRGRERLSQVLGAGDAEDFFQFLERTSNFDRAQSLTQSSVQLTAANRTQP